MKHATPPVPLNFLVPGFSKCGTTTLCAMLNEHYQLYMPTGEAKELEFFKLPDFQERWSWYANFFSDSPLGGVLGEGSQCYSSFDNGKKCRQQILAFYPQIKLIFIARDPIDRIESSYREFHHSGTKFGFSAPLGLDKIFKEFPSIIEDTRYFTRLNNYLKHMPTEQVLIVFLEDLIVQPDQVLKQCFEFLGVDPTVRIPNPRRQLNPGSQKLYDTQKLRDMRNFVINPETSLSLSKLTLDIQDQFLEKLGLRKPFTMAPLEWSQRSIDMVMEALGEEIPLFLEMFGKPSDFWPRFSQAVDRVTPRTKEHL